MKEFDKRCGNCRYFQTLNTYFAECRRHAPQVTLEVSVTKWPQVKAHDWCGEWKLAPTDYAREEYQQWLMQTKER